MSMYDDPREVPGSPEPPRDPVVPSWVPLAKPRTANSSVPPDGTRTTAQLLSSRIVDLEDELLEKQERVNQLEQQLKRVEAERDFYAFTKDVPGDLRERVNQLEKVARLARLVVDGPMKRERENRALLRRALKALSATGEDAK